MPCQDDASFALPEPFTLFSYIAPAESKFYLIGHTGGGRKEVDTVSCIFDPSDNGTKQEIIGLTQKSDTFVGNNRFPFSSGEHNYVLNEQRILFHCKSSKGASGAPGIQVMEDGRIIVVTMLLRGYPEWYYLDTPEVAQLKCQWKQEYCIEQGAVMSEICQKMLAKNPGLCSEVF